ncbi:heterokaryon incompatibility, partial [Cadophora sp. DSE1049]
EIRILGLEPGTPSDPIRCQLHHVKLSGNPIYEALSYMWGPKVFKIITLDGREYPVRENLWRALTHLRYKDSNLMLWIDAICIDQKDERERNHQVMQMGQIYNRASRVLAWLGLGEPSTNIAMEVLKRVGMRVVERIKMDLEKTEMDALEELCSREYWQRLWIVQEI